MITHQQAEKRVIVGFAIHFAVYVIVVAGLAALNFSRNPDHLWFLWVAAGRVEFIHDAVIPLVPTLVEVPPNRVLVGFKHLLLRPILRMG